MERTTRSGLHILILLMSQTSYSCALQRAHNHKTSNNFINDKLVFLLLFPDTPSAADSRDVHCWNPKGFIIWQLLAESPLLLPAGSRCRQRARTPERAAGCAVAPALRVMVTAASARVSAVPHPLIGVRLFSCFARCIYRGSSDGAAETESRFKSRRLPV